MEVVKVVSAEVKEAAMEDLREATKLLDELRADLEKARRAGLTDLVQELEPQLQELERRVSQLRAFLGL